MDIGRSISYVFQDPNWIKKVLIGGLLSLIPVFGTLIVVGYWIRIATNVANGFDLPLPDWNDFGGDFMRGLKAAAALIIWAIPLIILAGCGAIPSIALSGSNNAASSLAGIFTFGAFAFGFLLWIIVAFISPIIVGRVALSNSFSAAFQVREILIEARENLVPLLLAVAMAYALGIAAYFGLILCLVGYIFTSFLAYMMLSHLYGQLWRRLGPSGAVGPGINGGTISANPGN
ncbi:MAG TPA: DUF4013 domain-containing protein [Nitrolancea sp.]|nr:DUF4013 domain-containing protein [Nitrolancea sp.]